jgi:hypothetical protein
MTTSAQFSLVLQTFAVGIECRRRQELKEAKAKESKKDPFKEGLRKRRKRKK